MWPKLRLALPYNRKNRVVIAVSWCEEGDLNPYGIYHTPLKRARLPVPPPSHSRLVTDINSNMNE